MQGKNHEIRFKMNPDVISEIDILYSKYGGGFKKAEFFRILFILGISIFKEKTSTGYSPVYTVYPNKEADVKLERKK